MGAAMGGVSGGQLGLGLAKGAMTGLSQGLSNYGSRQQQPFNFTQLTQGLQNAYKKPPLGQGVTPNANNQFSQSNVWGGDPNINGGFYT